MTAAIEQAVGDSPSVSQTTYEKNFVKIAILWVAVASAGAVALAAQND